MAFYFAYGSNMDVERLNARVGDVTVVGIATAAGYDIRFNKRSIDGSGKANLVENIAGEVEGVIFDLTSAQLATLDRTEKGYHRAVVNVGMEGGTRDVTTYVADSDQISERLQPTAEYSGFIRRGAVMFGLSEQYRRRLEALLKQ